jgi:hypothetical protein
MAGVAHWDPFGVRCSGPIWSAVRSTALDLDYAGDSQYQLSRCNISKTAAGDRGHNPKRRPWPRTPNHPQRRPCRRTPNYPTRRLWPRTRLIRLGVVGLAAICTAPFSAAAAAPGLSNSRAVTANTTQPIERTSSNRHVAVSRSSRVGHFGFITDSSNRCQPTGVSFGWRPARAF